MKTKNIFLASAFTAYLYLFYQQNPGINFMIFSVILVIGTWLLNRSLIEKRTWKIVAFASVLTGCAVALYGNTLSLIGNFIALAALGGLSYHHNFSLIFACLQSVFSYLVKPFDSLIRAATSLTESSPDEVSEKSGIFTPNNFIKVALPLVIVLVFIGLYSSSNPVFSDFLYELVEGISTEFISFAMLGWFVVYFFFNQYYFQEIQSIDSRYGNLLVAMNPQEQTIFRTTENEFGAAKLTFLLLNILLLTVNSLDIAFIFNPNKEIISHTQYIHQGVNNSISSVLVAILVVLYFFRGNLNFIAENRTLKILAMLWIFQNMILLATCLHKNYVYIDNHGLTHKRIGVYAYLLVVFVGLTLTWFKIIRKKSNMFLVRSNSWSLFVLLAFSTLVNWNNFILNYNIKHHPKTNDSFYLEHLGNDALPYLLGKYDNKTLDCIQDPIACEFQMKLRQRKAAFIQDFTGKTWQSWAWNKQRIYNEITKK